MTSWAIGRNPRDADADEPGELGLRDRRRLFFGKVDVAYTLSASLCVSGQRIFSCLDLPTRVSHNFTNTKNRGTCGVAGKAAKRAEFANDSIPLGRRLRDRRQSLGLTLKEVADGAGLSVGFISLVERGLTAPSLSSLVSISKVLKTDISAFLRQPQPPGTFTRHDQRQVYSISGQTVSYERVSSSFPGRVMRSVIVHQPPGYRAEPISHEGEELIFVLEGEVTSEVGGKHTVLRVGDSVHHPSSCRHALWNHSGRSATLLWVGTMDLFGADDVPAEEGKSAARKRGGKNNANKIKEQGK